MSNFKRMRLINEDEIIPHKKDDIFGLAKHETSPHILRMSDLDDQINDILKSNLNEENKAKLYSQALRKFLTFKRLHQEKQILDRSQGLDLLKKLNITSTPRKIRVKKKKIPKVRKRKIIIKKKKKNIRKRPNLQIQEAVNIGNISPKSKSFEQFIERKKKKKSRNKPNLIVQEAVDIHNIPSTSTTSTPASQKFNWGVLNQAPKKRISAPIINLEDSEEEGTIDWSNYGN